MSFSSGIKEELARMRVKGGASSLAQLAGLTQTCASLRLARGGPEVVYMTESLAVGRCVMRLAASAYRLDAEIGLSERASRARPLTRVRLSGAACRKLLLDTGAMRETPDGLSLEKCVPSGLVATEDAQRAFLRGAFLGAGSCADPARGYHLEIVARTEPFGACLCELIAGFGPDARTSTRRGRTIVYVKGDDVSGFLALIGASNATLSFENVRVERAFRNYVNRTSNCETANIGKTVDAGIAQRAAIERIDAHIGLSRLPQPLYEAAMLRLSHPQATLQELADLAEIGKSGMNHRLARLIRMAEEWDDG